MPFETSYPASRFLTDVFGSSTAAPVYFCVSTVKAGSIACNKESLAELNGLHVDIDFRSIQEAAQDVERTLRQVQLLPSKVIWGRSTRLLVSEKPLGPFPATLPGSKRFSACLPILSGSQCVPCRQADTARRHPQYQARCLDGVHSHRGSSAALTSWNKLCARAGFGTDLP